MLEERQGAECPLHVGGNRQPLSRSLRLCRMCDTTQGAPIDTAVAVDRGESRRRTHPLVKPMALALIATGVLGSGPIAVASALQSEGWRAAHLGTVVMGVDDLNSDGVRDWAVSAPHAGGGDRALVLAVSGSDGREIWRHRGSEAERGLGSALSVCADMNGDCIRDIVAGAPLGVNGKGVQCGAVIVLSGKDGHAIARISGTLAEGCLGECVSAISDQDDDGKCDVVTTGGVMGRGGAEVARQALILSTGSGKALGTCGAEKELGGASVVAVLAHRLGRQGDGERIIVSAVRSKDGESKQWSELHVFAVKPLSHLLMRRQGEDGEGGLESTLVSLPDIDGDGAADIAVGAPNQWRQGVRGRVSAVSGKTLRRLWTIDGEESGDGFGAALAVREEAGGAVTVIVGAPGRRNSRGEPVGGIVAYAVTSSGKTMGKPSMLWSMVGTSKGSFCGHSVSVIGDVNGDGTGDVVVGAPMFDADSSKEGCENGCAYVVSGGDGKVIRQKRIGDVDVPGQGK